MTDFFNKNNVENSLDHHCNQKIRTSFLEKAGVQLDIKREDLIHPVVSGNKFRKLKYNIRQAKAEGFKTLLTFGGAYSNHIAATAAAGKLCGFETIGIIRGAELAVDLEHTLKTNATLRFASENGMQFHFISRASYSNKTSAEFEEELHQKFGSCYSIPEGGTNALAVQGCEEVLTSADVSYDYIACAVGTGGTVSGIINSAGLHQTVLGYPALRGNFLSTEIEKYTSKTNWKLVTDYHFGGYGKLNTALVAFINEFRLETGVLLDPLYTGKMLFGIYDQIRNGFFSKNTRILAIHTGGIQGISGINEILKKKRLPLIAVDYEV